MTRKNGSNGQRINRVEKDILQLQHAVDYSKQKLDNHIEYHVKEDLQQPRFSGSDKFLYTYEDIAKNHNIPKSRVQKIAEENGLNRRNLNIVIKNTY